MFYISATNGDETGSFSKSLPRRRHKMAVHGNMGELCLQHYCRANDVVDNETLAVLCSVCGLLMHKLIKNLLMSKMSIWLSFNSIVDLVKEISVVQCFKFNLTLQQSGEAVATFIALRVYSTLYLSSHSLKLYVVFWYYIFILCLNISCLY